MVLQCSQKKCMTANGGQHIGRRTGGFNDYDLASIRDIWQCGSGTEAQRTEDAQRTKEAQRAEAQRTVATQAVNNSAVDPAAQQRHAAEPRDASVAQNVLQPPGI